MQEVIEQIDDRKLYKELDKKGPFPLTLQGTLEPEAFVKFREIVSKHGYIAYQPAKERNLRYRV